MVFFRILLGTPLEFASKTPSGILSATPFVHYIPGTFSLFPKGTPFKFPLRILLGISKDNPSGISLELIQEFLDRFFRKLHHNQTSLGLPSEILQELL